VIRAAAGYAGVVITTETKNIPLFDLARSWPELRDEVLGIVDDIAARGAFSLGAELERFEEEFAAYCGCQHAVGTSSGTSAIELALRALGAGPGRSVATVSNTFVATIEAIEATGARTRLVDVDAATRCMDPARLERLLATEEIAAVVAVHLYGRPAPIEEIVAVCERAGVPVVEDCAQAHGATVAGRRVGSFGAAGAFSFYPTKNLGAFGDGGAVTTPDAELAATVRSLRHHGSRAGDANLHVRSDGGTERLDNLQAAILSLKLSRLDGDNERRRAAAREYDALLGDLPLGLPQAGDGVYHLYVVEMQDRDRVRARLRDAGVGAGVHYPTPVHLQPGFWHLGYRRCDLPATERLSSRVLSLPLFPGMTRGEQQRVARALTDALKD